MLFIIRYNVNSLGDSGSLFIVDITNLDIILDSLSLMN